MSTNSVAPLTSYTETLPAATTAAPAKSGLPVRTPSILLSPLSIKGRCTSKSFFHGALRRTSEAAGDIVVFRNPEQTSATPVHQRLSQCDVTFDASETLSPPQCDSPHAAMSSGRLPRGRAGSSVSSNTSYSRMVRIDGDPLAAPSVVSDTVPFATFTSHLRQRLAMSDAGIEVDGNNSTTNNEALTAVETKTPAPLPRLNSARGAGGGLPLVPLSSEDAVGGLPLLSPTSTPTSIASKCSCAMLRAATAGEAALDEHGLDAVSQELTALLRSADAAVELLMRRQRLLLPEQQRLLSHIQRISSEPPFAAELRRDATHPSMTSTMNVAGQPPKRTAQSSGCLSRTPPHRMIIRPQRNITWE